MWSGSEHWAMIHGLANTCTAKMWAYQAHVLVDRLSQLVILLVNREHCPLRDKANPSLFNYPINACRPHSQLVTTLSPSSLIFQFNPFNRYLFFIKEKKIEKACINKWCVHAGSFNVSMTPCELIWSWFHPSNSIKLCTYISLLATTISLSKG